MNTTTTTTGHPDMLTKTERRQLNKRAHAIRRAMTNADYRQARADGATIAWRDVAATYDAMPVAAVLAMADSTPAASSSTPAPDPAPRKRQAPAHVTRAQESFTMARVAWEAGLERALAGAHATADGGRPARGETYVDEERDYRDTHPAPVFRDFLAAEYAAMRHAADTGAVCDGLGCDAGTCESCTPATVTA